VDLGAGGGLPGLVLAALVWPQTRWLFVDAQRKRTEFLIEAVEALGLDARVAVRTERAEVVGRDPDQRGNHDLVVARSFGAPAITAECAAPLLRPGGRLVVSEPPAVEDLEARWPTAGLAQLGLAAATSVVAPDSGVHLSSMVCTELCPERYPRRTGIPAKRPLF
jgi:16S rRNA (guanine527-N7)-methyltransferase